jgi:hypothetical protein
MYLRDKKVEEKGGVSVTIRITCDGILNNGSGEYFPVWRFEEYK